MATDQLPPEQKLAAARWRATKLCPYFTGALLALVPRRVDDLRPPTIAVTKNLVMVWRPEFVAAVTVEELATVLVHEVNHVLRHHLVQFAAAGADPELANICGDLEINDDLRQIKGAVMPTGDNAPLMPEMFKLAPGKTWREYYAVLSQQGAAGSRPKGHGVCNGRCGSAGGSAAENEPGDGDAQGRSPADVERVCKETAQAVQAHAQATGRGSVPAGLERWAGDALKPPKVRWQDKLARATRRAVAFKAGAVDMRYSRPSRKQAGIGYGPGRPVLPTYVAPVPRVMVAVDTSGSMGDAELARCLAECDGVLRAVGSDLQFITCDADVHTDVVMRTWHDAARKMTGGGGTNFVPMFERAMSKRPRPEVLVVMTDGGGPAPSTPPPGIRVVWVLCGSHRCVPYNEDMHGHITYGDQIEVDD